MNQKKYRLKVLFLVTFLLAIPLALDHWVAGSASAFQVDLQSSPRENFDRLLSDAEISGRPVRSEALAVEIAPPAIMDRIRLRRICEIEIETMKINNDGSAVACHGRIRYSVGLLGRRFVSYEEAFGFVFN